MIRLQAKLSREERLQFLREKVSSQPTITDAELARELRVSIHTVRADRQRLGIPEVRQRTKDLAAGLFAKARSLSEQEIFGELLEIEPDSQGLSLLETGPEMGFRRSNIVRGHILFAQANSLAAAVVNEDVALTSDCEVQFISPVRVGERILAKARVVKIDDRKRHIEVAIKSRERLVFLGRFTVHGLTRDIAAHLNMLGRTEGKGD